MDIDLKQIPGLPLHQHRARSQATDWLENVWPLITEIMSQVMDFANTLDGIIKRFFCFRTDGIAKEEQQLLTSDLGQQGIKLIIEALSVLLTILQEKKNSASQNTIRIKSFCSRFQPAYDEFKSDFEKAISGNMTVELKPRISEMDQTLMKAKELEIAIMVDAVVMPATVETAIAFPEHGVGLLIGGLLFVGELGAYVGMKAKYADTFGKINQVTKETDQLDQEVVQLKLVETQITGLHKTSIATVDSSSAVANGWITLGTEILELIKRIESISPQQAIIVIKTELEAAAKDYEMVLEQAKKLLPTGGQIPMQKFSSVDDYIKALKIGI